MTADHAILVSLAEKPASGYDLARRFDRSIGFFWHATHQQIYRVLARMESDGMVTGRVQPSGTARPDRKVYRLTPAGRRELLGWTREPSPVEGVRSEFAVKIRALPFGDRNAVLADIARTRAAHARQLEYYRQQERGAYPDPDALSDEELPAWLVLRGGIRQEAGYVRWCDEMLSVLRARSVAAATPGVGQDAPGQEPFAVTATAESEQR